MKALTVKHAAEVATFLVILFYAVGGTAVGTGLNSYEGFAEKVAAQVSRLTGKGK